MEDGGCRTVGGNLAETAGTFISSFCKMKLYFMKPSKGEAL
jgi:hypothetical protein